MLSFKVSLGLFFLFPLFFYTVTRKGPWLSHFSINWWLISLDLLLNFSMHHFYVASDIQSHSLYNYYFPCASQRFDTLHLPEHSVLQEPFPRSPMAKLNHFTVPVQYPEDSHHSPCMEQWSNGALIASQVIDGPNPKSHLVFRLLRLLLAWILLGQEAHSNRNY